MDNYFCIRLLSEASSYLPTTKSYGEVDIRPGNNELDCEIRAINESLKAHKISMNIKACLRLATFVEAVNEEEAIGISEQIFEETLDCFDVLSYGLSKNKLMNIGYVINLSSSQISPLKPKNNILSGFSGIIVREKYPQIDIGQYLLNNRGTDISKSLIRAGYWDRMSKNEVNKQLKFLFKWFAIESLCRINQDEDIMAKLLISLGFISKKYGLIINKLTIQKLLKHPRYKTWRKWIQKYLEKMRKYRNNSVHNAFRLHELTKKDIAIYNTISTWIYGRLRNYISEAINNRIDNLNEFWEYMPVLLENNNNLVNDLHNNIICMLENPSYL
jgi:hypothetical protein